MREILKLGLTTAVFAGVDALTVLLLMAIGWTFEWAALIGILLAINYPLARSIVIQARG